MCWIESRLPQRAGYRLLYVHSTTRPGGCPAEAGAGRGNVGDQRTLYVDARAIETELLRAPGARPGIGSGIL